MIDNDDDDDETIDATELETDNGDGFDETATLDRVSDFNDRKDDDEVDSLAGIVFFLSVATLGVAIAAHC
jgi:hypothetical protein